jgi:hypothetical protein
MKFAGMKRVDLRIGRPRWKRRGHHDGAAPATKMTSSKRDSRGAWAPTSTEQLRGGAAVRRRASAVPKPLLLSLTPKVKSEFPAPARAATIQLSTK